MANKTKTRTRALLNSLGYVLTGCLVSTPLLASPADLLFQGGAVFTASGSPAEVVAVRKNEIVYAGSAEDAAAFRGPNTRIIDIGDGLLAPGFVDAHVHPVMVGLGLTVQCDLSGIGEKKRILAKISECAAQRPGESWLIGRGWALGAFPESKPSAADLDSVLPEGMAAYITAEDGHNGWASSEAFRRAGVDADTPDPAGGHIERLVDGSPQGTLRERAMQTVTKQVPELTSEQLEAALAAALRLFNSYGITTVVDAGVGADEVARYQRLRDRGELSARSVLALWVGPDWDEDFSVMERLFEGEDPQLRVAQIKLMLDGVMENQTAHLSFDYPGLGHRGTLFFEEEARLQRWATRFEALGYQLHFHTVGDAAISQGLKILAASRKARGAANNRPVFAHDYLVLDKDYAALREAGAFMQLTLLWDQQNDSMVSLNRPSLTETQYASLMPADRLLAEGIPVIGGSDAPVGQSNPLSSIQVALTGQGVPYFDGGDMGEQSPMPGGRVDLSAMLKAYTIEAARALAMDGFTGSIEVGKRADLVLIDRNLLSIPKSEVYGTGVRPHRARRQSRLRGESRARMRQYQSGLIARVLAPGSGARVWRTSVAPAHGRPPAEAEGLLLDNQARSGCEDLLRYMALSAAFCSAEISSPSSGKRAMPMPNGLNAGSYWC